jgi:hypothetical protein
MKINNNKAAKEPHVPGAYLALPIPPSVAIICVGFLRFGKLFIRNAYIH